MYVSITFLILNYINMTYHATGVCQPSCVNGVCNETTGHCACTPGYSGVACDESKTLPHSIPLHTVCMYPAIHIV